MKVAVVGWGGVGVGVGVGVRRSKRLGVDGWKRQLQQLLPLLLLLLIPLLPSISSSSKTPASGGKMIAAATLPGRLINDSTLSQKVGQRGEEKGIALLGTTFPGAATPDKHV